MLIRLTLALMLTMAAVPLAATPPPNVIVIHADDLGWADLGCYGSTFYETPHLDRFAGTAVRFTNAYATCPVCSPSRASLMTGQHPARLGMTAHVGDPQPSHWTRDTPLKPAPYATHLPKSLDTLADRFHQAGYATMHAGKWHLGAKERNWPEYHGFDVNAGGWSNGGPFGGGQYFTPYANPRLRDGPEGEYLPERLSDEVARFIAAHQHEPFFIHFAPYLVHVPLQAKEALLTKYEQKRADLPELESPWIYNADGKVRARQDLPVYAAMVEALDAAIGRVLKQLDEQGLRDNTIVVFTSDNGGLATGDMVMPPEQGWPTTNAPLRAGKGWLYEGGIREPLIVRAPGVSQPGTESAAVVSGVDYYPTLLHLAGLDVAEGEAPDGRDFTAALRGESYDRDAVFWHYPHYGNQGGRPGSAIRQGDWKLIEWYTADGQKQLELFNLADDLAESTNVADQHPDKRDTLHAKLVSWREEVGALEPTANEGEAEATPVASRDTSR